MDDPTDEKLLEAFKTTGEMRHFEVLVQRHIGRVRGTIYGMVLNDADADELTQEVFLRVSRSVQRFQGRSGFSTWLFRITMNTVYSFLRRRQRNRVDLPGDVPDAADRASRQPDRLSMDRELGESVSEAMERLSPPLRSAIALTVLEGMDVKQAAQMEGCMTATMYWRVHEARKQLKQMLGMSQTGQEA